MNEEKVAWKFMLPLVLSTMMNPLNSTMLATALITLCSTFKISVGSGAILITSLYVTATIAQPLMGRLADIYNAKKVNTLGFILVLLATLIGIFAPNLGWLIVSRIVLGIGTSAAYPSAITLINKKYAVQDKEVPGSILGIVAISSQVSMVIGPTLGGLLTQWFGWRGILFINIPWVIVGLFLSRAIPDFPVTKRLGHDNLFKTLDVIGILFFSAFLLALLNLLMNQGHLILSSGAVLITLTMMVVWEWNCLSPFIDIKLLVNRPTLSLVYIRTLVINYILYLLLYSIPQWIQEVKHILPAKTGLIMLPMTVMAIAIGLLTAKRNKPVLQNVFGVLVMITACAGILLLNASTPVYTLIGSLMIVGLADGINMIANQSLLNREAPLAQKGVSFGLYRTAGYIGAIISSTQLKTIFHPQVTDKGLNEVGYFAMTASVLLLLLLWPLIRKVYPKSDKLQN
jgi:MFS family permease